MAVSERQMGCFGKHIKPTALVVYNLPAEKGSFCSRRIADVSSFRLVLSRLVLSFCSFLMVLDLVSGCKFLVGSFRIEWDSPC